jgi:hypothetical protein
MKCVDYLFNKLLLKWSKFFSLLTQEMSLVPNYIISPERIAISTQESVVQYPSPF